MPNWTADVITPFTGSGSEEDPNRPLLGDDYATVRWSDITGTPSAQLTPAPNMYVLRVEVSEAMISAIQSDGTYLVLSAEEILDAGQI